MRYKRIQIVGSSGSGKTTLARVLSKKLGIPHYELDGMFWLENWQERQQEDFETIVNEAITKDTWILCGDYIKRLNGMTLKRADVVIWLNYPLRISLFRMIKRTTRRLFTREKLWGNNRESFLSFWFRPKRSLLWLTIKMHKEQGRRRQETKMKAFDYRGKVLEFRHPKEVEKWLSSL